MNFKKLHMRTLTLLAATLLSGFTFAQNVVFQSSNEDHTIGDNLPDTVEVNAESLEQVVVDFDCFITNNEAAPVDVKIKREIISYVSGAQDQLCFGGACILYDETDEVIESKLETFEANQSKFSGLKPSDDFEFDAIGGVFHYLPFGNSGTTIIKYTLISVVGEEETIEDELVVRYTAGDATNVNSVLESAVLSKPYPNPFHNVTRIKYTFNYPVEANLVVTNIIGSQVFVKPLYDQQGEVIIELSEFPAGLYFVNLESNGEILTNQKLIKR